MSSRRPCLMPPPFAPINGRGRLGNRGFTLVEMLTNLTISGILVMVIFQLMVSQQRAFTKQQTATRAMGNLRGAVSMLTWELQTASAADGDLYAIGSTSFSVRSLQGQGIVCGIDSVKPKGALLWNSSGDFPETADDSALVFVAGNAGSGDDTWRQFSVAGGGKTTDPCAWDPSIIAEKRLKIAGDTTGVRIGAPLRAFRRTEYSLVQDSSEWWLARRVGAASSYELMAGPLAAPADSGLVFTWYDRLGNVTTTPGDVAIVQIRLRDAPPASSGTGTGGQSGTPKQETVLTRVSLRG